MAAAIELKRMLRFVILYHRFVTWYHRFVILYHRFVILYDKKVIFLRLCILCTCCCLCFARATASGRCLQFDDHHCGIYICEF